eukprot:4970335-Pleurochrysis_carterae.AAC.4
MLHQNIPAIWRVGHQLERPVPVFALRALRASSIDAYGYAPRLRSVFGLCNLDVVGGSGDKGSGFAAWRFKRSFTFIEMGVTCITGCTCAYEFSGDECINIQMNTWIYANA